MEVYQLPQDIVAEQNVLGSCMLNKEALNLTVKKLNEDDFMKPQHKKIFEILSEMNNKNENVDVVTVNDKYKDINYLAEITSNVVTCANIKNYVNIVKSKSIRRKYIKSAQKVIANAYEGDYDNLTDFKSDCLQEMDIDIKEDSNKESPHIIDILNKVLDNMGERQKNGETQLKKTGFDWLDKVTGGLRNNLTFIGARPSVGKTTFAINIMLNMALQGLHVAMFNLEMTKEDIIEKVIAMFTNTQNDKISRSWLLSDEDWNNITSKISILLRQNIYIYDDIFDVEQIRYTCRELKNKKQLDCVFVDYLQLCTTKKKMNNTNDRVSHISRSFKMMQKEFKTPFWVLAQLSRDSSKEGNRKPILTDLRDSGSIEQDADTVIFLHDENYNNYEQEENHVANLSMIVAKQRLGVRDVQGYLKYYKRTQRMY